MAVLSVIRTSFSRSSDALVSPKPDEQATVSLPPVSSIVEEPSEFSGSPLIPQAMRAALSDSEEPAPPPPAKVAKPVNPRRWTIQRLMPPSRKVANDAPRSLNDLEEGAHAAAQATDRAVHAPKLSSSDRRALHNATVVRALIVGPETGSPASSKPLISKSDINKTKAALLQPREANKVIARLRALPPADAPASAAPIHAVCLSLPELEADKQHFQRLKSNAQPPTIQPIRTRDIGADPPAPPVAPTVASATFASVSDAFDNLNLISLVSTPDFGLGGPANGPGILSGALPSAEAVVDGIVQITPQLMSLGYATGRAIVPNHTGIYPPTDRMSVLTYWWGLEVVMPHPTMAYLSQAQSISHTVMNFLSALAVINNGVREILPFVRYISQFMEFEFSAIKGQDKGKGVVCAATWIMPAAMVPRPWDFQDPPPAKAPAAAQPSADSPTTAVPSTGAPNAPELPAEQEPTEPPSEKEPATSPETPAQPPTEGASRPESPPSPLPALSLFPGGLAVGNT